MDEVKDSEALQKWQQAPKSGLWARTGDPVTDTLLAASEGNKDVEMIYHGGSQPGLKLKIRPRFLFNVQGYEHGYVEAYSHKHLEVRRFRLDKIELAKTRDAAEEPKLPWKSAKAGLIAAIILLIILYVYFVIL